LKKQEQFALSYNRYIQRLEHFAVFLRLLAFQRIVIVTGKLHKMKMLLAESSASLREKMKDKDFETRWMAIQVVGIKRYHLEPDLLDRLSDPDISVRQAARKALSRLGRGVDFGPSVKASLTERQSAERQWREWWAIQDGNPERKESLARLEP
jgi:HEAT repeat protein